MFDPKQYTAPVFTGEILKADFKNSINNDNPFYKKKVVLTGFNMTEMTATAVKLKLLGADIDASVGSKTNILIVADHKEDANVLKMKENIAAMKDGRIMEIAECNSILAQYLKNYSAGELKSPAE